MSLPKPDFADPASVVTAFILAMHGWETLAGALRASVAGRFSAGGSSMHPEEVRVSQFLRQIPPFIAAIFLTPRGDDYAPSGSYAIPPEYDPGIEAVTQVIRKSKSQVVVETERKSDNYGGLREYVLKSVDGVWLIDSVTATVGTKKRKLTLV
jgi:hypothetical protein